MSNPILLCEKITKTYREGKLITPVLKGIDLQIQAGEQVAIMGQSGSGKSTLLHILGGLDRPTSGKVILQGQNLAEKSVNDLAKLRNRQLGFVYQFHHLLSEFTALENVMLPALVAGRSLSEARASAKTMLTRAGLAHRWQHKPSELSGGERQRVALVRALINYPACVLADEPTGNLDQANAALVISLLRDLYSEAKTSLVVVTHDKGLAQQFDRIIHLKDGNLPTDSVDHPVDNIVN